MYGMGGGYHMNPYMMGGYGMNPYSTMYGGYNYGMGMGMNPYSMMSGYTNMNGYGMTNPYVHNVYGNTQQSSQNTDSSEMGGFTHSTAAMDDEYGDMYDEYDEEGPYESYTD